MVAVIPDKGGISRDTQTDLETHRAQFQQHLDAKKKTPPTKTVVVKKGDTLHSIAERNHVPTSRLYKANPKFDPKREDGKVESDRGANGGWDPDYLVPGDTIEIPLAPPAKTEPPVAKPVDPETARETRRAQPDAPNNKTTPVDPETARETRRAQPDAPNNKTTPVDPETARETRRAQPGDPISKLNSPGDQAVFSIEGETSVVVKIRPPFGVGGQMKMKRDITVTRDVDSNGQTKYVVSYNKKIYEGAVGRVSTPDGKTPATVEGSANGDIEVGMGETDTINMEFRSPEDAREAVDRLTHMGVKDTAVEVLKLSPAGKVVSSFIDDPIKSDPLLGKHVTSYSTTLHGEAAVILAGQLKTKGINLAVEGEGTRDFSVTREVKVDAQGNATQLKYSAKATFAGDYKVGVGLDGLGVTAQDVKDIGSASLETTMTWKLSGDEARGIDVNGPAERVLLANPRKADETSLSLTIDKPTSRETWSRSIADGVTTDGHKKERVDRDGSKRKLTLSIGVGKKAVDIEFAGTIETGVNDATTISDDKHVHGGKIAQRGGKIAGSGDQNALRRAGRNIPK